MSWHTLSHSDSECSRITNTDTLVCFRQPGSSRDDPNSATPSVMWDSKVVRMKQTSYWAGFSPFVWALPGLIFS